ncbi:MAG: 2-amino-4-hydroxy-6-hydroxymethyldihydropteridine diphosphokinase [Victivallaceae bacterium]|jgi:dihydroneopterin aldolase/2-amino-4-hydroxy-6-hydroxymethyldihydropteridine diphosphokinase
MTEIPHTEPWADAFVAIGSNIKPEDNIPRALAMLNTELSITAMSNFYRTAAAGSTAQPDFLNGVVKIKTAKQPHEIKFDILRKIEERLGRVRSADKFAPRTIDLDLILYGTLVVDESALTLPDQSIRHYSFVAVPLWELAPDLLLPDTRTPLSAEPVIRRTAELHLQRDFTGCLRRLILS